MITIKNKLSIQKMQTAGQLLAEILDSIVPLIKPGISTLELDSWIEEQLNKKGLASEMKGYAGPLAAYKHVSCISLNNEVVHGIPHESKILKEGDLVKIDVCASWNGYCADLARCFFVGAIHDSVKKFVEVAQNALNKGIEQARAGNHLSDISAAIQKEVETYGYGVVRDFAGHGIGKKMHEEPEVLNYGKPGQGPILKPGMAFAIEPMITMGKFQVYVLKDGWTVKTVDNSLAAHIEDTVVVTENEPFILTRANQQGIK
jgi:methionyl aminopeptidase